MFRVEPKMTFLPFTCSTRFEGKKKKRERKKNAEGKEEIEERIATESRMRGIKSWTRRWNMVVYKDEVCL